MSSYHLGDEVLEALNLMGLMFVPLAALLLIDLTFIFFLPVYIQFQTHMEVVK